MWNDKPQNRKRCLFPKVLMSWICTECLQIAKKNINNPTKKNTGDEQEMHKRESSNAQYT